MNKLLCSRPISSCCARPASYLPTANHTTEAKLIWYLMLTAVCVSVQALARKHEEAVHQLRSEGAALLRQEELEAGLVQRGLSEEGEGERRRIREDQLRLAAAQEEDRALSAEQRLQLLKETHDIRRELQHQVVREREGGGVPGRWGIGREEGRVGVGVH